MCSDIIAAIKTQCEDMVHQPATIQMHVLDAVRWGVIPRIPRKHNKSIKTAIRKDNELESAYERLIKKYGVPEKRLSEYGSAIFNLDTIRENKNLIS